MDLKHSQLLWKVKTVDWCLQAYIDPQNRNHARMEARNLLELGDNDGDDRLSLQEVIDNMDLFYGSKMVNTGLSFHDEF